MKKSLLSGVKLLTASFAVSGLLIGCSSSDDSSDSGTKEAPSLTVTGSAVDGYLVNSIVCLDLDKDGQCTLSSEPYTQTDATGEYSISVTGTHQEHTNYKNGTAPLIVFHGYDSDTKEDFEGKLKAPFSKKSGTFHITPLSTMAVSVLEANSDTDVTAEDIAQAQKDVADALGIDEVDVKGDPVALAKEGNSNAIKAALQIHKAVELMAANATGSNAKEKTDNSYLAFAKGLKEADVSGATGISGKLDVILDKTFELDTTTFTNKDKVKAASKSMVKNVGSAMETAGLDLANTEDLVKIALQIQDTKKEFETELEKGTGATFDTSWDTKHTDHTIANLNEELVKRLLSLAGYTSAEIGGMGAVITTIATYSEIKPEITLDDLKNLLNSKKPTGHIEIVAKIDGKKNNLDSVVTNTNGDLSKSKFTTSRLTANDWYVIKSNGDCVGKFTFNNSGNFSQQKAGESANTGTYTISSDGSQLIETYPEGTITANFVSYTNVASAMYRVQYVHDTSRIEDWYESKTAAVGASEALGKNCSGNFPD
ncbi:MAG: hypothetical protein OIF32_12315 [Campylobacterales bacterium]|nr:hypothetical protein [Campylobacterales bacterium]